MKKTAGIFAGILLICAFFTFSVFGAGSLDYAENAPGGEVSTVDELISAFGKDSFGNPNATLLLNSENDIRLINSVILDAPIIIKDGEFTIVGGGCTIARGFNGGAVIIVDGSSGKSPILKLERPTQNDFADNDEPNLIINGNEKSFGRNSEAFIKVLGNAKLVSNNRVLYKDITTDGNGGAISAFPSISEENYYFPTLELNYNRFDNCKSGNGGAVYFEGYSNDKNEGVIDVNTCYFNKCVAADNGGALSILGGKAEINAGEMVENTAEKGGAIYACAEIQISETKFTSNYAGVSGGAVYCAKEDSVSQVCKTMLLGIFAEKNRSAGNGGMITNDGICAGSNIYIDANSAAGNGGGVYNTATFLYTEGSILNNKCDCIGGGVYNHGSSAVFQMSGGEINANTAIYAGGVYSEGYMKISGGAIGNNRGDSPEVMIKGEFIMSENAVVTNKDVIGLCGSEGAYPVIKLESVLTNKAIQKVAFYTESNGKYVLANKAGMTVLSGEQEFVSKSAKLFDVSGSVLKNYSVTQTGNLQFRFPLMPLWAWILSIIAVSGLAAATVLFIRKRNRN